MENIDVVGIWQMITNFLNKIFTWLIFIFNKDLGWGDVII